MTTTLATIELYDNGGGRVLCLYEDEVLTFLQTFSRSEYDLMWKVIRKIWDNNGNTSEIDEYNKILGCTSVEVFGTHGIFDEEMYGAKLETTIEIGVYDA